MSRRTEPIHEEPVLFVDRRRPGHGYRHVVRRVDVEQFAAILPAWAELSAGVDAIVLAPGDGALGSHSRGVVGLHAWPDPLCWRDARPDFVARHEELLDVLDVEAVPAGEKVELRWTAGQARGFQLLHVLLRELGRHRDELTSRSPRAEPYAAEYARAHEHAVRGLYLRRFSLD
jgi:hypothetical protein